MALYRQALALQRQGKLQQAVKLYKAALQGSPELVSALNNLGVIYIRQKNPAEARRVLEMAIRKDSRFVDPYYNLACLYAQQKDIGRSLFYLKKAISVNHHARQWAATDEDLKNLRGNVEYERIIKEPRKS
ncbi:MAG: tetratricopeptide repeat protein [Deltaproteobacteria bacterium]|nr:tetratricopeptide repeat protein [Deltaproteobacteria bacterium]